MTIPQDGGGGVKPRPTPLPYHFYAAFMTDEELIDDAIAFADLAIVAAECAAEDPLCGMPPATRLKEARDLAWRIILTRRGWRGESSWPTLRDRLRGCRLPGRPTAPQTAGRRSTTAEAAEGPWCLDPPGPDGGAQ